MSPPPAGSRLEVAPVGVLVQLALVERLIAVLVEVVVDRRVLVSRRNCLPFFSSQLVLSILAVRHIHLLIC